MPRISRQYRAGAIAVLAMAALPDLSGGTAADDFAAERRALEDVLRPRGPTPPGRYVYVVSTHAVMKTRVVQFAAWFDARDCAVPLAANHEPLGVVANALRGRLERSARAVRIDAHVTAASGAPAGRAAVDVRGGDDAAVARAAHDMLRRLSLICGA